MQAYNEYYIYGLFSKVPQVSKWVWPEIKLKPDESCGNELYEVIYNDDGDS